MRLMVGVGRERDQRREKCLSVSVKRLLLFCDDVGCWNNFFLFGFFCAVFVMSPFFFGVVGETFLWINDF